MIENREKLQSSLYLSVEVFLQEKCLIINSRIFAINRLKFYLHTIFFPLSIIAVSVIARNRKINFETIEKVIKD